MEFVELDPARAFEEAVSSVDESTRLIVCGDRAARDSHESNIRDATESPEQIIDVSMKIDVKAWFQEHREELVDELEEDPESFWDELEGEWPETFSASDRFQLNRDILTGEYLKEVFGVRLAVKHSWEIPAHLYCGGWNECPEPEVQCAIWRHWEAKYGAKIVGVGTDVIEAHVTNPPKTREEAMELAWEQCLFCIDIVDQGTETVACLAAELLNRKIWFFWWD